MNRRGTTIARPLGALCALLIGAASLAQVRNPVYVDDSPAAAEGLARARELGASGNEAEAVRVVQRLLTDEGDRVIASAADADLFVSVRERIHRFLLDNPPLLQRYRELEEPLARRELAEIGAEPVERSRLLTASGFEAALRVAQRQMERGRLAGARSTLEQLERHPDRRGPMGRDAAQLLAQLGAYLDDPTLHPRAERWAREAGGEVAEPAPVALPGITDASTPLDDAQRVELDGMLSKPLGSESVLQALDDEGAPEILSTASSAPAPYAQRLHIFPAVSDDTIYVNSGETISAWDRLTLTPRWGPIPLMEAPSRGRRPIIRSSGGDDLAAATVHGPWLLFTTPGSAMTGRAGSPSFHALFAESGQTAWSIDVASLDPALAESVVRGPAVCDQGVAVVAAFKHIPQRRLLSVQLVGVDVASGEMRWRRQIASAGSLPYGQTLGFPDASMIHDGIVYRMDSVGVIAAVEAATGRTRWIRRIQPEPLPQREADVYELHTPIMHEGVLYSLSPDRRRIFALDPRTGEVLADADDRALGRPRYLLIADGALVGVDNEHIHAAPLPLNSQDPGGWRVISLDRPGVRGRVVGAGDSLLIPVRNGLLSVGVKEGDTRLRRIELDRPGNIVALEEQLVVADDESLHSYLLWEVAERMLAQRIRENPADPTPAVTYAELAYRAGRPEAIVPAADLALDAIEREPASDANAAARARLFDSILAMLDPAEPPSVDLPAPVTGGLIDRLALLAASPEDRVAQIMVAGAHAEALARPSEAVSAYQSVLEDKRLAEAVFTRRGVSSRADVESTRRLRRVVRAFGPGVYATFEREARAALDQQRNAFDPSAFERIAARYPVSASAAEAWLEAARLYDMRDEPERALGAVEAGLVAAEDALLSDGPVLGELVGRLVTRLADLGQAHAARATLARYAAERPALVPTSEGSPIDVPALLDSLESVAASDARRPRFGAIERRQPQALAGWTILEPLVRDPGQEPSGYALLAAQSGEFGVFTPDPDGGVAQRYSVEAPSSASLLRLDEEAFYISIEAEAGVLGGRSVSRYDAHAGARPEPVWTTPPFRSLFMGDMEALDPRLTAAFEGAGVVIQTPLAGNRSVTELIVAFDQRTLALVERSGRAAAFDLETGQLLWKAARTVPRVHDAAASAGVLLIGGASEVVEESGARYGGPAQLLALDLRSGRVIQRVAPDHGQVRWVRMTPAGRALAGFDHAVMCLDVFRSRVRWTIEAPQVRTSVEAWSLPGRLIVLDSRNNLWQIDEDSGAIREEPLDARGRVERGAPLRVAAAGDHAVFTSPLGVAIFDRTGAVAGRDVRAAASDLLPAAFGAGRLVAIDAQIANVRGVFVIHQISTASAALLDQTPVSLGADPVSIAAIDGRVLVTAGDATVVYDAPVD